MMKRQLFVVAVVLVTVVFSCTTPKHQSSATADLKVHSIDYHYARKLFSEGAVFIDNRPLSKYKNGHIDGAINLPFFKPNHSSNTMTKENLLRAIGDNSKVVFYCTGYKRAYHALRQAQTWKINKELFWYQNGYNEWSQMSK